MPRDENQQKIVLDPDQVDTLREALHFADLYATQTSKALVEMGQADAGAEFAHKASKFHELFTYSPEVVRVAVTIDSPGLAPLRAVQ